MSKWMVATVLCALVAVGYSLKLQFDNLGWRQTASTDIAYAAFLADQYRKHFETNSEWPRPEQLVSRLTLLGSSKCSPGAHGDAECYREDRYRCGLYGNLTLSIHLMQDGSVQIACN